MKPIDYLYPKPDILTRLKPVTIAALLAILLVFGVAIACADTIDVNRLADAIYKAENSKAHPYGIMAHYKHTTNRQACLNSIASAKKRWNGKGDFVAFLAKTYAPLNAKNDPKHLNINWTKNVRYYYERS